MSESGALSPAENLEIIWSDNRWIDLVPVVERLVRSHAHLVTAGGIRIVIVTPFSEESEGHEPAVRAEVDGAANVIRITIGVAWIRHTVETSEHLLVKALIAAQVERLMAPVSRFLATSLSNIRPLHPRDSLWWTAYCDQLSARILDEVKRGTNEARPTAHEGGA